MKGYKQLNYFTALWVFIILLLNSCVEEQYDKTKALEQAHTSLNIGYETYLASEDINSLLYKVRDLNFEMEDIEGIYSLSQQLVKKTEENIDLLSAEKKDHNVTSLFESTITYLESVRLLEENIPAFVESIVDSTLVDKPELNQRIAELAMDVQKKGQDWQNSKTEFYTAQNIGQKAIDSIEKLITKK